MNNKYPRVSFHLLFLGLTVVIILSCKKNLPDVRLSLEPDSRFTTTSFSPVLGRNTLFSGIFNAGGSSQPLTFKIANLRRLDGSAAPELQENFPVVIWNKPYLGDEKSLAEIEAKRGVENRRLFEIREHSGQFLMWAAANSAFVKTQPDSGYVFDVEVFNSGGRKFFRNFKLKPFRERPYEPSNLDPITGLALTPGISPSLVSNIRGERTSRYLGGGDINVFFKKSGNGNSLTFSFLDSLYHPIDPNNFSLTKWPVLVHGFNMVKTNESVRYDVAYPIPLITYKTAYTTPGGAEARVAFKYERQGFGNIREEASLGLDFNIFEKGDWEIIFQFKNERPKFAND